MNFCSWKDRKAVAADLRRIYSAPTADMAEAELNAFEEKWAGKYASIGPAWHRPWAGGDPVLWLRSGDLKDHLHDQCH